MSGSINGRRIFAVVFPLLAALLAYVVLCETTQLAQTDNKKKRDSVLQKYTGSDEVTQDIRRGGKEFARVRVANDADRIKAGNHGRIVADYGGFVIVAKNMGTDISGAGLETQTVETSINLPGSNFEPVNDPPSDSLRLGGSTTTYGKGYYVLQFGGTAKDEWLDALSEAGVEVLQYVSHQAYFVYGEGEAIAKAANHSRVRWIGSYRPEQKISQVTKDQIAAARNKTPLRRDVSPLQLKDIGTALFDVAVFARADIDVVAERLKTTYSPALAKVSRLQSNFLDLVRVELELDEVESVASMHDVFSIEAVPKRSREDERSSQILAGNYSSLATINGPGYNPLFQFGVDGSNVTVAVNDDGVGIPGNGGFYITAANAVDGPLRNASSGATGHGHLNASIIAGRAPFSIFDPAGYNYGSGVAPGSNIVNIPMLRPGYNASDAVIFNDTVTTPGPNGVHPTISNNSWGDGTNGNVYNSYAAQYDGFVRDSSFGSGIDPLCIIFSAGNEGAIGLTQPKMAKNVIAVANSENLRPEIGGSQANNIDDLNNSSSRGPAADSRIKPDISAPGSVITGGSSGSDALFGNIDANHRWSSGTSHAAPHIAGMAALFTQYWKATQGFGQNPSPALIKAAIINTGRDMNGNLSNGAIPNGNEGWGRANLKMMFPSGRAPQYIDQQVQFNNTGESFGIFTGTVDDSSKPTRVTLVWTDPPGVADPALVNNLDLIVTIGGAVYKGNVFSNGVSVAGGTADTRNNVENVFLPAGIPAGTSFAVQVIPTELNGDGILSNGDLTDQHYALVAYNYSPVPAVGLFSLSGRAAAPNGRGVPMARVRISSQQGQVKETFTNQMGYFSFTDLAGGQTHTVSINSKRFTFANQTISLNSHITGITFIANGTL